MMITIRTATRVDSVHTNLFSWRRVVHTDVHDSGSTQEPMKDTKSVRYRRGYKIVRWPERMQPYTIWKGDSVVRFCATAEEVERWLE